MHAWMSLYELMVFGLAAAYLWNRLILIPVFLFITVKKNKNYELSNVNHMSG